MAEGDDDVFNVDATEDAGAVQPQAELQPPYRIYEGSRIAVSRQVGPMWQKRRDAAHRAYTDIYAVWEECLRYYNNHQEKTESGQRGVFRRGDSVENVIFSNLNILLPAIYNKNPRLTCTTIDSQDEPFCKSLEALLNVLFSSRTKLNAKPKIKKSAGLALLTNLGALKLDWELKDDSRLVAVEELQRITDELAVAKDQQRVDELYGQLEALEMQMEVRRESGPCLSVIRGDNLLIDPYAEMPDALDSGWIMENVFLGTSYLNQRFTKPDPESDPDQKNPPRVLVYKPTHKAVFTEGQGTRDDGLGVVMEAIAAAGEKPTSFETDERRAYREMYYTECWYVWDKATRRVMLFHRDDWKWPIWVWDDPLNISRFYPYFVYGFVMTTGGTVGPGEVAFYLDQQDEVNDINRQMSRMRRSVFDYWFYNADKVNDQEIEPLLRAIRGDTEHAKKIVGIRAGEGKISDVLETIKPPQLEYEALFNKQAVLETINRLSNTSDALRGVQFKTNTTEDAVKLYQDSMQLSIGSKVDVIEDTVSDLAEAVAELCVQRMDQNEVAGLIGQRLAQGWRQMTLQEFNTTYTVNIVAGSMEKPNSIFKKKEAVEIAQAVGQFAQAAPGATLKVMLRSLQSAFTELVLKPEDWEAIDKEIAATLQKGVSTGAAPGGGGGQGQLPPELEQEVVRMKQSGASDDELLQFIQQNMEGQGNGQLRGNRQQ